LALCSSVLSPCPVGVDTYSIPNPIPGPPYRINATGYNVTSFGSPVTLRAGVVMGGVEQCFGTKTVDITNPPAWWQVRGGDVWAGKIAGSGTISSSIPSPVICILPTCDPVLIRDKPSGSGFPGVAAAGLAVDTGASGGSVSSQDWLTEGTSFLDTDPYGYDFFDGKIPGGVTLAVTVDETNLENPPASALLGGYYWFKYSGGAPLTLSSGDGVIGLGGRKIILFVDNADVTINTKISVTQGLGAFYLIADQDVTVSYSVGDAPTSAPNPDIEGLIFADGQVILEGDPSGPGLDKQLFIRGSLSGLGKDAAGTSGVNDGVVFERDLPNNSLIPAELVEFAPDMVLTWPPYLARKNTTWKEVAP